MRAPNKNLVLAITSATSSLIMLDSNIVAVALPTIARDLHGAFSGIQWVISAYLIPFASLLLPSGTLADRHGRRLVLQAGLVLFLISSAICGLASSLLALELARAVQGVGGALLLTASLAVIASTFTGPERARAFAVWGTALGAAITLGPIVGGVITSLFGWRWTFLINVPLCLGYLVAVRAFVAESRDPGASRLDVPGMLAFTLALFAIVSALIDGNDVGWLAPTIVLRLVLGALALTAFVALERRTARPMLDLSLFRRRSIIGASFGTVGYGTSAQVMIFFLPLFLQHRFGLAPFAAGLAMIPFAVPLFIAPRVSERVVRGWAHRDVLTVALAIVACGDGLMAITAQWSSTVAFGIAMAIAGAGTGMLNPETARALQSQIPPERAGMASGIGGTTRFVSLLVGVAVLGAIYPRAGFAATAAAATLLALANLLAVARLLPGAASAAHAHVAPIEVLAID